MGMPQRIVLAVREGHRQTSLAARPGKGFALAQPEEQRANLTLYFGVDDAKQRCPTAAGMLTPHGEHGAPARPQYAAYRTKRGIGVGHVHQPQRTDDEIKGRRRQRERLCIHAIEPGLRNTCTLVRVCQPVDAFDARAKKTAAAHCRSWQVPRPTIV